MARHLETSFHATHFKPFLRPRARTLLRLEPNRLPGDVSKKRSLIACLYLLAYVTGFLALGFAGIAGVGWLWMSMMR
jgi:hypothetical protein